jgi:hypothetical protein
MTDSALLARIESGRLRSLLDSRLGDSEIVDELFLATLSRAPEQNERPAALDHIRARPDRAAAFFDVLWALLNTREFILNH